MTELSDVAAIVTAAVALYAGVLSTYNFIDKRKERKPRLRLGYRPGFFGQGNHVSETIINLEVANIGTKPVQITSHSNVQVLLPNGQYMVPMEDWNSSVEFPYELQPGSTVTIWHSIRDFAHSLQRNGLSGKVRFRVICHDGAGRVYRGKKLPFDIEAWSRSGQA